MPLLALAFIALTLAMFIIPAALLRRAPRVRAQDWFVASERTPPAVVRNASIAAVLPVAALGPLFAWGARGEFWPALLFAAALAGGIALLGAVRRAMADFQRAALDRNGSVTVHAFIARAYGDDPRVRLAAASLAAVAALSVAVAGAFALAALIAPPVAGGGAGMRSLLAVSVLAAAFGGAVWAGQSGVLRAAQTLLGLGYFFFFGAAFTLLYVLMSSVGRMPPFGTVALVALIACCAILLAYRGARYIDTSPARLASPERSESPSSRPSRAARLFRRFEKVLNPCITVFVVGAPVLALMTLYAVGLPAVARDVAAPFLKGAGASLLQLAALVLAPLLYPVVDPGNWQRLAAFEKNEDWRTLDASARAAGFRRIVRIYALEAALLSLVLCALGAIAALATALRSTGGLDAMGAVARRLAMFQNPVSDAAGAFLLAGVTAFVLAGIASLLSAGLCALRYDIAPSIWPSLAPGRGEGADQGEREAAARRRAMQAVGGLAAAMAAAFAAAGAGSPASLASGAVFAPPFALICAQLAFVPFVLGSAVGGMRPAGRAAAPGWALLAIGAGGAVAAGALVGFFATGEADWLWAAAPGCLAAGVVVAAIGRLRAGRAGTA